MQLDQDLFRQLAKVSIVVKKMTGQSIDLTRIVNDHDYASRTLALLDGAEDEEIIVLGLSLKSRLGLLTGPKPEEPVSKPAQSLGEGGKYKFGARGG